MPAVTRHATLVAAAAAALALGAGALLVLPGGGPPEVVPVAATAPVPVPTADLVGAAGDAVPWTAPLVVAARQGELVEVEAREAEGEAVPGALQPDGTWRSADRPLAVDRLRAGGGGPRRGR